mgnify:CR=1 FL=1
MTLNFRRYWTERGSLWRLSLFNLSTVVDTLLKLEPLRDGSSVKMLRGRLKKSWIFHECYGFFYWNLVLSTIQHNNVKIQHDDSSNIGHGKDSPHRLDGRMVTSRAMVNWWAGVKLVTKNQANSNCASRPWFSESQSISCCSEKLTNCWYLIA